MRNFERGRRRFPIEQKPMVATIYVATMVMPVLDTTIVTVALFCAILATCTQPAGLGHLALTIAGYHNAFLMADLTAAIGMLLAILVRDLDGVEATCRR